MESIYTGLIPLAGVADGICMFPCIENDSSSHRRALEWLQFQSSFKVKSGGWTLSFFNSTKKLIRLTQRGVFVARKIHLGFVRNGNKKWTSHILSHFSSQTPRVTARAGEKTWVLSIALTGKKTKLCLFASLRGFDNEIPEDVSSSEGCSHSFDICLAQRVSSFSLLVHEALSV